MFRYVVNITRVVYKWALSLILDYGMLGIEYRKKTLRILLYGDIYAQPASEGCE
ncbi:unnamed protein product [Phyllotreta striolata]|uniref:Uncharacterized protein n=1 Tax=Phyllotreta striolata TaxID=444603 RepID=A0A9N9XPP8_PHYSR|nr:unnamed protein product [Phyllotreta striolata]